MNALVVISFMMFISSSMLVPSDKKPVYSTTFDHEADDSAFSAYWLHFSKTIRANERKTFVKCCLDSIECDHTIVHIETFMKVNYPKVFDDDFKATISDKKNVEFMDFPIGSTSLPPYLVKQFKNNNKIVKQVSILKIHNKPRQTHQTIVLQFILTRDGYKFCGYDTFG